MIIYLLVSIAIMAVLIFMSGGFIIIILPQYAASVAVGFIIRVALSFVNLDNIDKYVLSALLSIILVVVFFSVDLLIAWDLPWNAREYIVNLIKSGSILLIIFYIPFLASFFFHKQVP